MSAAAQLVIMLKEPRPGTVKTRLAADIGTIAAAWWFRHASLDVIRRLQDPRWRLTLAVAPHNAQHSRVWPGHIARIVQGRGDLGARMRRVFQAADPGPVCIIGADIPDIRPAHVAQAFAQLGHNDAVFGPAVDGGYWLIGLRQTASLPRTLFDTVRWSSPHALDDTVRGLPNARIGYCATLRDIDTVADLA